MKQSEDVPPSYLSKLSRLGFRITDKIGYGLSGSVYLADQSSLGRKVAIKFGDSKAVRCNKELKARFKREAKMIAKLTHPVLPYVLTSHETEEGIPFFIMQYIDAEDLGSLLQREKKLDLPRASSLCLQILSGLEFAHNRRVIHRDVKPSNILVSSNNAWLIDFSIAVQIADTNPESRITKTGNQLGSVYYSSPEQLKDSKSVDARSDIYSLGVVLFQMVSGQMQLTQDALTGIRNNSDPRISEIIETATREDPGERFQSAGDFSDALIELTKGVPLLLGPTTALCTNFTCPGAAWSDRGFYKGPNILEACTRKHCGDCGSLLIRACARCRQPFESTPYCGYCGHKWFEVPECKSCGSHLMKEDMEKDTTVECCVHGNRKRQIEARYIQGESDSPF